MKFTVEQKPFMSILSSMQPICTKRSTDDTTAYIMFQVGHKELVLKSTDKEISLQASHISSSIDIDEPTSFLVAGKRIFDLVKELDGSIEFSLEKNQLMVINKSVRLALNIKDAQLFPQFPERIENLMQFDAKFLLDMLNSVAFVIPQNNANPALNGLFLEISTLGFKMTTTDGHCLAQVSTSQYTLDEDRKWLLPRRAIFELKKIVEGSPETTVFLGVCGNQLVFSGESFNFFTRLLVDAFPTYQPILDKTSFQGAVLDRASLIKTLRRSTCLLSGEFIATQFGFRTEKLQVSMKNNEVGNLEEALPLYDFNGQDLDIRFYAPYLLSGLQAFGEEKLYCYLKNSSKPIIFQSEKNNTHFLYLVMPVAPTAL